MNAHGIRPFVAGIPKPIDGESILGWLSRAFDRTVIVDLKHGLGLAEVRPFGNVSGVSIVERHVDGLATLFSQNRSEIARRLHPKSPFDHYKGEAIDFFGTKIRTQYLETIFRRVSPRALALSPYHRAVWDLRPFCFDPTTRELLLDTCPVCNHRMRWTFVRGPTHCEVCVDGSGWAATDLRDHPQPLVDIADEEAIGFVTDLVDVDPDKRSRARKLLPSALTDASNSDVFEAVMAIASCFRPEVFGKMKTVGRPLRAKDFVGFGPDLLEIAGRMIIGGEMGFAAGTARLRGRMQERGAAHGLFAEIGPLAGTAVDPSLAPIVKAFLVQSFERDLDDTNGLGLVRRRLGTVRPSAGGSWLNMQEANELFGLSKHVLQRLAASGAVETRRTESDATPVLMKRDEIAPFAAMYKDAIDEGRARAILRLSAAEIGELVERGIVERLGEPVTSMMDGQVSYRRSSVRAVLMAIKERAVPAADSRSIRDHLMKAATRLPPPVPWAAVIDGILSGDIAIELLHQKGLEWRRWVAPIDPEKFEILVATERAQWSPRLDQWISRQHAAQMLKITESSVYKLAASGLLASKRERRHTIYKRADVETAARKYIFLPEMLERSPFTVEHEVGRWLRTADVLPVTQWSEGVFPVYEREAFERVLPAMPRALADIEIVERPAHRVSTAVRRKAVAEVKTGLSAYFVARRLGVSAKALTAWVAHFDKHGDVPKAGKMDGHEERVRSAIEKSPSLSTHRLWLDFNQHVTVGYTVFSEFIRNLGYERDGAGCLVRKQ
ncbi:MAG: hypothetical protein JWL86_5341 [Rhizobium sp.]|nr:hypothetical protein [Rhizobium sp.]